MAELVIRRYATALFDVAISENKLEQYETEVKMIVKALKDEPDFVAVLQNQKVTLEEKVQLIKNIFQENVEPPIVGLIVLLVRKNRQENLPEILEFFLEKVKQQKGILKAVVTSAVALKENQLSQIKIQLEKSTKSQVDLEAIVDETIIAGLIIKVADKVVDASVKGEMNTLKKQLSELKLA